MFFLKKCLLSALKKKLNISNLHQATKKPFTISVEGNIGSGKTTFISHFKNNDNILPMLEPIEEWKDLNGNNLLNMMYKDPVKWAFTFQTYIQLTMTQLHEMETSKPVKIMERSLYSARYCFVENLFNQGLLPSAELSVLDEWFKWLINRDGIKTDLIVYLRTSPEVSYERIRSRDHKEEENISFELIKNLHKCHEDWLYFKKKFHCPAQVLVLNANKNLEKIQEEYITFQNQLCLTSN